MTLGYKAFKFFNMFGGRYNNLILVRMHEVIIDESINYNKYISDMFAFPLKPIGLYV